MIIIKLEEQKNFMVLGKKDLTKDLMATLVWFWMEIKKYTDVLRYIFFKYLTYALEGRWRKTIPFFFKC